MPVLLLASSLETFVYPLNQAWSTTALGLVCEGALTSPLVSNLIWPSAYWKVRKAKVKNVHVVYSQGESVHETRKGDTCIANGVVWQQKDAAALTKLGRRCRSTRASQEGPRDHLLTWPKAYFKRNLYFRFCHSMNPTQALLYQSCYELFALTGMFLAYSMLASYPGA